MINNTSGKRSGAAVVDPKAIRNIPISLSGGKTIGKGLNGQTLEVIGKTAIEIIELLATESIYPTYTPATVGITQNAAAVGEVGESVNNTLTATFARNDAGALTALKIKRGNTQLAIGATSPLQFVDAVVRTLGVNAISYQALASYGAGALKIVTPGNTPDDRPALIRSGNAPQAAETDFPSGLIYLSGFYKIFYGPVAAAPANSAQARVLPYSRYTNSGNSFVLATGTTQKVFCLAMPATNNLVSVSDQTASNTDITSQYVLTYMYVNDAAGTQVAYKIYTMSQAVAYTSSHNHLITIS